MSEAGADLINLPPEAVAGDSARTLVAVGSEVADYDAGRTLDEGVARAAAEAYHEELSEGALSEAERADPDVQTTLLGRLERSARKGKQWGVVETQQSMGREQMTGLMTRDTFISELGARINGIIRRELGDVGYRGDTGETGEFLASYLNREDPRLDAVVLSLWMFDVNWLKRINDEGSHAVGDQYLRMLGKAMRSVFQRETDLNSRWAGDELGTASEISDKNSGYRAGQAQALQALFTQVESIRSELALSEQKGTLSVGIMNLRLRDLLAYVAGSTMWTPEERSKHTIPEELMKLADAALYQGKRLEGIRENVAYEVTEFITPPRDIFEMKGIIPSTEVKNAVGVTQVRL